MDDLLSFSNNSDDAATPETENHWIVVKLQVKAPFASNNSAVRSHLTDVLSGATFGPDEQYKIETWWCE